MAYNKSYFLLVVTLVGCASGKLAPNLIQIANENNDNHLENALSNILIPRVVGTPGHEKVKEFIANQLTAMGFETEYDQFVAPTPIFGNLTFTNVVGRFNPKADNFLTLACHYDTKYFPDIPNFLGAVDSAVSCAIILNVAKVLLPSLQQIKNQNDIGLMLIFFDGEEAFLQWNEYDSLYGSNHLAQKLEQTTSKLTGTNQYIKDIDRIDALVLLDLVGAANSRFNSFYGRTEKLHNRLVTIERGLANAKLLEGNNYQFFSKTVYNQVADDHLPFFQRDVPILHLIAVPFPAQWHTAQDNARNLHWPSIRNFNKVIRLFVYQYLVLNQRMPNLRSLAEFGGY